MSDVISCKLKDLFHSSVSGEWGTNPFNGGNSLVLRAADFTKDCKLRNSIGAARTIPLDKLGTRALRNGDILIEKSGGSPEQPVGRVAYFDRQNSKQTYSHSNFLQLLRVAEEFDSHYAYYLMAFLYNEGLVYKYQQQTTGIINLKLESYLNETITIPSSILIQNRIQEVLSTIDQTIEKTEALIAKYKLIKAGLMHDLFTRGIGADGKLRPPREQAPELYHETSIGWIPNDWDLSGLKSMSKNGVQHLRTGPFGSALKGEHWVEEGHPVITIGSLGEGEFNKSELLYIGNKDVNRLVDFKLKLNDVVFSRVADVGRSIVIKEDQVGWIMSSNLMRISLDPEIMISDFLQYQLSSNHFIKKQIRCKVNSGGRDLANSEVLNSLCFVKPSYDEQLAIVERAKKIDMRLRTELSQVYKLEQQKQGLMHDLLTGKITVTIDEDSDDSEVAHV